MNLPEFILYDCVHRVEIGCKKMTNLLNYQRRLELGWIKGIRFEGGMDILTLDPHYMVIQIKCKQWLWKLT